MASIPPLETGGKRVLTGPIQGSIRKIPAQNPCKHWAFDQMDKKFSTIRAFS